MKSKKKINRSFLKQMLILAILAAPFLYVICTVFLEPVVPRTRTYFKDYETFRSKAYMGYFPEVLPESASNVSYCYHVNFFKKGSGYSCILNAKDYDDSFDTRLNDFVNNFSHFSQIHSQYVYSGTNRKVVSFENDFNGRLNFLKKILTTDNSNDYYYLTYIEVEAGDALELHGIIMNDNKNQLVEFQYREPIDSAW